MDWIKLVEAAALLAVTIYHWVGGNNGKKLTRNEMIMKGAEVAFQAIEWLKIGGVLTGSQSFNMFLGKLNDWLLAQGQPALTGTETSGLSKWTEMRSQAAKVPHPTVTVALPFKIPPK